jgi:hypothetical protein
MIGQRDLLWHPKRLLPGHEIQAALQDGVRKLGSPEAVCLVLPRWKREEVLMHLNRIPLAPLGGETVIDWRFENLTPYTPKQAELEIQNTLTHAAYQMLGPSLKKRQLALWFGTEETNVRRLLTRPARADGA